jgi:hypothetical protein
MKEELYAIIQPLVAAEVIENSYINPFEDAR